jgi:hypothetical protein
MAPSEWRSLVLRLLAALLDRRAVRSIPVTTSIRIHRSKLATILADENHYDIGFNLSGLCEWSGNYFPTPKKPAFNKVPRESSVANCQRQCQTHAEQAVEARFDEDENP